MEIGDDRGGEDKQGAGTNGKYFQCQGAPNHMGLPENNPKKRAAGARNVMTKGGPKDGRRHP